MKFNRLRIANIGVFNGVHFDFDLKTTEKNKNVILFGGKNGSGKTTILEAIRLVLFGPFAYGLKSESAVYLEKIEAKMNTFAKKKKEHLYQIILDFEMVESLKRNKYIIKRSWTKQKSTIKEEFSVQKNDQILKANEIEIFQTKLREDTPPQLLEFCLFDGEKISQAVSNDTFSSYLEQTAKVMFNLDLFENLENDLANYIKQENVYGTLSEEEKKVMEIEKERDLLLNEKQKMVFESEEIDRILDEKNAALNELNHHFNVHGGLVKERREALMKEMNEVDHKRLLVMEKNKEFIATLLPIVLVRDLLGNSIKQMHNESKLDVKNNVKEILSVMDLQNMLEPFTKEVAVTLSTEQLSNQLYNQILDKLSTDDTNIIHNASSQQRASAEGLYQQVKDFSPDQMLKDYKNNAVLLKKILEIRKKIDANDASSDLKDLLNNIKQLHNEISCLDLKKEQQKVIIGQVYEQLELKESEYQSIKGKMISSKKAGHVFEIASRITDVSRLFRERQMKKKLQQVELETTRMLQFVFRKELFITRVKIDPSTFQLKIYNTNQENIHIEGLSAGEKQILLLSTVWAMAMCSKRRLPFVFDTLFGRLDQTHKKTMIEQFIPRCGEQVIILSTDSEINEEHYQLIEESVAKSYTIDFDTKQSTVNISNNYFKMNMPSKESIV